MRCLVVWLRLFCEHAAKRRHEIEYRKRKPASSIVIIMYISRKDEKIYRNMFVIGGDDALGMPHG